MRVVFVKSPFCRCDANHHLRARRTMLASIARFHCLPLPEKLKWAVALTVTLSMLMLQMAAVFNYDPYGWFQDEITREGPERWQTGYEQGNAFCRSASASDFRRHMRAKYRLKFGSEAPASKMWFELDLRVLPVDPTANAATLQITGSPPVNSTSLDLASSASPLTLAPFPRRG